MRRRRLIVRWYCTAIMPRAPTCVVVCVCVSHPRTHGTLELDEAAGTATSYCVWMWRPEQSPSANETGLDALRGGVELQQHADARESESRACTASSSVTLRVGYDPEFVESEDTDRLGICCTARFPLCGFSPCWCRCGGDGWAKLAGVLGFGSAGGGADSLISARRADYLI